MKTYPTVLTIAGSDCSGGAGIQADIKSISANGAYAASVITALTAQNTCGVQAIEIMDNEFITAQCHAVFADIDINSVKIGMLANDNLIQCVTENLIKYQAKKIVVDPVMIAQSGDCLIDLKAIEQLKQKIFPLADLITPNIPEAEILTSSTISSEDDMQSIAIAMGREYQTNILLKGGHAASPDANDFYYCYKKNRGYWFSSKKINTKNTHGTGCSLSSAIAAYLAQRKDLKTSIELAKDYISEAIDAGKDYRLGKGQGPINHFF